MPICIGDNSPQIQGPYFTSKCIHHKKAIIVIDQKKTTSTTGNKILGIIYDVFKQVVQRVSLRSWRWRVHLRMRGRLSLAVVVSRWWPCKHPPPTPFWNEKNISFYFLWFWLAMWIYLTTYPCSRLKLWKRSYKIDKCPRNFCDNL